MKAIKILLPIFALTMGAASAVDVRVYPDRASNLELGLTGGYYNGLGAQVFVGMPNLAGPIGARLSASFAGGNGGFDESVAMPLLGSIASQKASGLLKDTSAKSTTVGLDATYALGEIANNISASVYGGLRYGHFTSSLDYGDNLITDYTSNRFGLGAGVEADYAINSNLSAIANLGFDYYLGSDITRRDSEGNTDTQSADELNFVKQPNALFKAGLGLKYRF